MNDNRTALIHRHYAAARARAEFYLWAAVRGHEAPGKDPINGMRLPYGDRHAVGAIVYKAQARYWIKRSTALRDNWDRRRLP